MYRRTWYRNKAYGQTWYRDKKVQLNTVSEQNLTVKNYIERKRRDTFSGQNKTTINVSGQKNESVSNLFSFAYLDYVKFGFIWSD
jgi:hypothetical protein